MIEDQFCLVCNIVFIEYMFFKKVVYLKFIHSVSICKWEFYISCYYLYEHANCIELVNLWGIGVPTQRVAWFLFYYDPAGILIYLYDKSHLLDLSQNIYRLCLSIERDFHVEANNLRISKWIACVKLVIAWKSCWNGSVTQEYQEMSCFYTNRISVKQASAAFHNGFDQWASLSDYEDITRVAKRPQMSHSHPNKASPKYASPLRQSSVLVLHRALGYGTYTLI